jgi:hypothetical protein
MSSLARRIGLGLALLATVAASIWAGRSAQDGVEAAATEERPTRIAAARTSAANGAAESGAPVSDEAWQLPERAAPPVRPRNPFAVVPPPPPLPRTVAAEAAPQAPPLPFSAIGRLTVEGKPSALLMAGTQTYVIAVGDPIGEFRLEAIEGDRYVFVHVPTGLNQTLVVSK